MVKNLSNSPAHEGIVVLGHPRSGTTLLRRLLDGHSNIACPGETHILSACARFLQSDTTADGLDMGVLGGLSFSGFSDLDVLAKLREFAFNFPRDYAQRQGKSRWAEKTAFDIFHLDGIEQLCGSECYFVGIVRHGLDVAISTQDFTKLAGTYLGTLYDYIKRFNKPLEAFAHSWVDVNTELFEFGVRHPENCIICRYEDLVDDPEYTLAAILEFVGESFEPGMINTAMGKVDELGFSDHKSPQQKTITIANKERWHELPTSQLHSLATVVNPMLEKCGYDPVAPGPELTVDEARRRYALSLLVNASWEKGNENQT